MLRNFTLRPIRFATSSSRVLFRHSSSLNDRAAVYREKLEQKAKEMGVGSVDELKSKLKDDIEKKKAEFNAVDPLKELTEFEKAQQLERDSKTIKVRSPVAKGSPQLPYKSLDSYMDVEKLADLGKTEIEFLWKARFQLKERSLHAVVDNLTFATMYANAFKNPSFILPLPRNNEGYEMHFVQWSFVGPKTTHCMLTTVAEYKLHKEYAKPHTTLMFHQELQDKDVILMNGQVEKDAALTMDEAQLLVLNIQRFYAGVSNSDEVNKKRLELLRSFTRGDEGFDMDKLVEEATKFD